MIRPHPNLLGEQIQTPVEKQMSFFVDPTSETPNARENERLNNAPSPIVTLDRRAFGQG